ncbi:hypothetical protein KC669_02415 [Candidatus Dojkabacteria bacterium]|uniref:Uncharacterized protein n=1 Tax=Candidatus Dojkabacteria bacterium TaxID=2099670 RepID=A0A955L9Z6_9BACT|nr:hypothetical protein [Candidatus Dojkabacteria bacterium]
MNTKASNNINIIEPIVGVVFGLVFYVLFNRFYDDIQFITSEFEEVKDFYNFSILAGVFVNLLKLFFRSYTFKTFIELVPLTIFIALAYKLWILFPFDTSVIGDKSLWDNIFRFLLAVPPILYAIGTITSIVKVLTNEQTLSSNE